MVSLPWYLLAAGIVLVVIGTLLSRLAGKSGDGRSISSRMSDDDIARELQRSQRPTFPSILVLAGFLCILASVCWRIARAVL